jgi:hypothetical protein
VENDLKNSTHSTVKRTTNWIIALALISIVTPFVYMKIGPIGIKYYGKDVPDIYILGGYILGKDTSFWGINFAYKFQVFCILLVTILTYGFRKHNNVKFLITNISLLLGFPFWLEIYTDGVICNSDTTDLTIYPMPGLILWAIILILHILLFMNRKSNSKKLQNTKY